MFPNQSQIDEVVKEDSETIENTMKFVYPMLFHLITPYMDLSTRSNPLES